MVMLQYVRLWCTEASRAHLSQDTAQKAQFDSSLGKRSHCRAGNMDGAWEWTRQSRNLSKITSSSSSSEWQWQNCLMYPGVQGMRWFLMCFLFALDMDWDLMGDKCIHSNTGGEQRIFCCECLLRLWIWSRARDTQSETCLSWTSTSHPRTCNWTWSSTLLAEQVHASHLSAST